MSVEILMTCDGDGCFKAVEFDSPEHIDAESCKKLGWRYEGYNELHYCPACVKKMIESGEIESPAASYKAIAKSFIDANVWDGEDRSGAKGDCASFNPDELQELIDDLIDDVFNV